MGQLVEVQIMVEFDEKLTEKDWNRIVENAKDNGYDVDEYGKEVVFTLTDNYHGTHPDIYFSNEALELIPPHLYKHIADINVEIRWIEQCPSDYYDKDAIVNALEEMIATFLKESPEWREVVENNTWAGHRFWLEGDDLASDCENTDCWLKGLLEIEKEIRCSSPCTP